MLFAFCQWLEQSPVGATIHESTWQFPLLETVHILGIVLLVGGTSIVDLRLTGLALTDEPVSKLARQFLPWAWAGLILQIITGVLLFASEATKMYGNPWLEIKLVLLLVACINAMLFHFMAYRGVGKWDSDPVAPLPARAAGTLSILLWIGVVAAGRWIGYA